MTIRISKNFTKKHNLIKDNMIESELKNFLIYPRYSVESSDKRFVIYGNGGMRGPHFT